MTWKPSIRCDEPGLGAEWETSSGDCFQHQLCSGRRHVRHEVAQVAFVPPELLELAIWDSVKESSNAEMYSAYLERYGDGAFASLANVRLEALASTSLGARGNDAFVQVSGCQQILYIENTIYQNCKHRLGYLPVADAFVGARSRGATPGALWRRPEKAHRYCAKAANGACNWLIGSGSADQ